MSNTQQALSNIRIGVTGNVAVSRQHAIEFSEKSPLIHGMLKFYVENLGIDLEKSVLYNSVTNTINFGDDNKRNYESFVAWGDRFFSIDNKVKPDLKEEISKSYCDLVKKLIPISNKASTIDEEIRLEKEIEDIQSKIDSGNLNARMKDIQEKKLNILYDKLDSLTNNQPHIDLIKKAKKNCDIMSNQQESGDILFETLTGLKPKIFFDHEVKKLQPVKNKYFWDLLNDVMKGSIDLDTLSKQVNFFQSYFANNIFKEIDGNNNIMINGRIGVAFEDIIYVPIRLGNWFDTSIYNLKVNTDVKLTPGSYKNFYEYCKIPTKIILGMNPVIIYSKNVMDFINSDKKQGCSSGDENVCNNENDNTMWNAIKSFFGKDFKIDTGSSEYNKIVPNKDTPIVIGYEVDNHLCHSILLEGLKEYDNYDGNHDNDL